MPGDLEIMSRSLKVVPKCKAQWRVITTQNRRPNTHHYADSHDSSRKSKSYIRWDNFLVPMQCTGNLGCFSQGKLAAIARCYAALGFFPLWAMFLCLHTTGSEAYSFTTDRYGIFNVRTNLGACCSHEGGSGTNKSAQELTQRDRKNCPSSCRTWGSNPWSSDLNSDSLTTDWATSPVTCCCCSIPQLSTLRVTQYLHPHSYMYKYRCSP